MPINPTSSFQWKDIATYVTVPVFLAMAIGAIVLPALLFIAGKV